jgi:hypothetical protein
MDELPLTTRGPSNKGGLRGGGGGGGDRMGLIGAGTCTEPAFVLPHQLLVDHGGGVKRKGLLAGIHEALVEGILQRRSQQEAHGDHHGELPPHHLKNSAR